MCLIGNARATVFHKPDDFDAFLDLMAESSVRTPMPWSKPALALDRPRRTGAAERLSSLFADALGGRRQFSHVRRRDADHSRIRSPGPSLGNIRMDARRRRRP